MFNHTHHHIILVTYIVISKFFFFVSINLVAVCCYITLVGAVRLLGLVCRVTSLYVVMKLCIKKILTDFCDTRTHFSALACTCFHEPTRGISQSCEYAAHVSKNASHIATLALDVPFPEKLVSFFFFLLFEGHRARPSHAIAL
jgi:hypothetical protein